MYRNQVPAQVRTRFSLAKHGQVALDKPQYSVLHGASRAAHKARTAMLVLYRYLTAPAALRVAGVEMVEQGAHLLHLSLERNGTSRPSRCALHLRCYLGTIGSCCSTATITRR